MRDLKAPLMDWRVRVSWLDVAGLVAFAAILLRDDTLLWTWIGVLLFAVTLGQVWLKWRLRHEYPFLMVFWMTPGG